MAVHNAFFRHVVLQPTLLCNLDCDYCYLPDRSVASFMSPEVARKVATDLAGIDQRVRLIWHGGEPLSTGKRRFKDLAEPFESLRQRGLITHGIQTNATLISDEWCEFFQEYGFSVGVSLDGDERDNALRVNKKGEDTFARVMRGIRHLREHKIPFSIIAVVSRANIRHARRLYEFFQATGCTMLNINVEELEGLNASSTPLDRELVTAFWRELFDAWRDNPTLKIREFDKALGWLGSSRSFPDARHRDMFPTVSTEGDVVLVSPEFISVSADTRHRFVVGNVLASSLEQIVQGASDTWYVEDFLQGAEACQASCKYFAYCGGGMPSNKFFEHGRLDVMETQHCVNTRQLVMDTVLVFLNQQKRKEVMTYNCNSDD